MQEKLTDRYLIKIMTFSLLCSFFSIYSHMAYVSHSLKECVRTVNLINECSEQGVNLQELSALIEENRVLAGEDVIRAAVVEALDVLKVQGKRGKHKNDVKSVKKYLKEYLNNLDQKSLLLAMEGTSDNIISWPLSFVTRSLPVDSTGKDIIYLSAELALKDNVLLSGSGYLDSSDTVACENSLRKIKENEDSDPSINFNANSMTNSLSSTPTIIFGTGVASPILNAWIMRSSNNVQSPINIQFSIPGDLKKKKAVSLELHFLVKRQPAASGKARIRVDAKYMSNNEDFNILLNPIFSDITDSDDFVITEPAAPVSLRHIRVIIPLDSSEIRHYDLALLSLTRIAPEETPEYGQDIYLAAAAFRYTRG